ncbi:MAG TPA: hypothetical protein VGV40_00455, partial [Solirubrobacteraceae bacterium]|nr:hypothetical protein [Solirubrobacteraceae bacterium]
YETVDLATRVEKARRLAASWDALGDKSTLLAVDASAPPLLFDELGNERTRYSCAPRRRPP